VKGIILISMKDDAVKIRKHRQSLDPYMRTWYLCYFCGTLDCIHGNFITPNAIWACSEAWDVEICTVFVSYKREDSSYEQHKKIWLLMMQIIYLHYTSC